LKNSNTGSLYVVATPIGNLADFSERARMVLDTVDLILAEDTRHSMKLLNHYGISSPLLSLHEYNEKSRVAELIGRLLQGQSMALVSDAGTPLISDPGYRLVTAAIAAGVRLIPVPGPSAMVAALSVAGQPTDKFVFEGYLSAKAGARRKRLAELRHETRTLIFYETPHRLQEWLIDAVTCFGAERRATLAKELTKQYEQIVSGTLQELQDWLAADPRRCQGEFVLVVAGNPDPRPAENIEPMLHELLKYLPVKTAAAVAANLSGRKRNELYAMALSMQRDEAQ
jgi:16S rRNA (cytidine1402-2'-O)-methyltransferase